MKRPVVLVVRSSDRFSDLLRDNGLEVLNFPLIKTEPLDDLRELDLELSRIDQYDGLFFTSPVAAQVFIERSELGCRASKPEIYVLGERARKVLENAGFDVVHDSLANTSEELIGSLGKEEFAGKRFLFLRGEKSLRTIPSLLEKRSSINEVVVYRTIDVVPDESVVQDMLQRLEKHEIDWICFFSPSGIDSYLKLFGTVTNESTNIAVIGQTTAKKAAEADLKVLVTSSRSNTEAFADDLIKYIKSAE